MKLTSARRSGNLPLWFGLHPTEIRPFSVSDNVFMLRCDIVLSGSTGSAYGSVWLQRIEREFVENQRGLSKLITS